MDEIDAYIFEFAGLADRFRKPQRSVDASVDVSTWSTKRKRIWKMNGWKGVLHLLVLQYREVEFLSKKRGGSLQFAWTCNCLPVDEDVLTEETNSPFQAVFYWMYPTTLPRRIDCLQRSRNLDEPLLQAKFTRRNLLSGPTECIVMFTQAGKRQKISSPVHTQFMVERYFDTASF